MAEAAADKDTITGHHSPVLCPLNSALLRSTATCAASSAFSAAESACISAASSAVVPAAWLRCTLPASRSISWFERLSAGGCSAASFARALTSLAHGHASDVETLGELYERAFDRERPGTYSITGCCGLQRSTHPTLFLSFLALSFFLFLFFCSLNSLAIRVLYISSYD